MIEVVRSRLDARERHRWERALAKAPILAERAPRARGPFLVAVTSACLTLAMLLLIAVDGAWNRGELALGALTAGGLMLVGQVGAWMWREARSAWPSGRFLFSWGYVEVEHDRLRYVDARAIEPEITEEGVTLRAGAWSTQFRGAIDGSMLAPLGAPRIAGDGYREGPWVVVGPDVRAPRLSRRTRTIVWAVTIAALGAVAGHAARAARPRGAMPHGNQASDVAPPTARMPSRTHRF